MILFRCNADARVGMGHLVRCRVLAERLKALGESCVMIGPTQTFQTSADQLLFETWIERPDWADSKIEAQFMIETADRLRAAYAILDDYRSDGEHQRLIRDAGMICLQQYDASKPQSFAANFVMNSSPSERLQAHAPNFLRPDVEMLLGPNYAIIRPEFLTIPQKPITYPPKRILITFGGGDDRGGIAFCLQALGSDIEPDIQFIVMAGSTNPSIPELKAWATRLGQARLDLQINPNDVPNLINSCDAAILSGGTTTFEAAYCGLPMLLLPIAANQYRQGEGWAELGAATYLGPQTTISIEALRSAFSKFINGQDQFIEMSQAARSSVDGQGLDRVLNRFLKGSK